MKKKKLIILIVVILVCIAIHTYSEQESSDNPSKGMTERLTEWEEMFGWE